MPNPFTADDALYGFVAPAVAALIVAFVLRRLLPGDVGERYASSISFAAAIAVGNWLLVLVPWTPETDWHWLPYAAFLAAVIAPAASASGVRSFERVVLYAVTALIAAWHLAPTWEGLDPSRAVQITAWTLLVTMVAALLYPLPRYIAPGLLDVVLAAVVACGAVVLICSDSKRFCQLAGLGAGAMAGLAIAAVTNKQPRAREPAALPFAVFLCGAMWIGQANSFTEVPLKSYLLVPVSPLLLWICAVGPLARTSGVVRLLLCLAVGSALAVVAAVLAVNAATPVGE